ncbi:MAG: sigma-70 family RNA polymerase sigma factor [Alphaproteobacteria bacterium]|nr:sigma-70 family RNA polymerase sigma factor [Alphaproteobacteria bacterium]MBU0864904.1 sigma-70 family RNA polymerase sigma factor [Alphaproteobacteria bacterium]MBU1824800.1 sigma-70 family RNA polymerase sigma factor [Alphaproteobacteria bacterium]
MTFSTYGADYGNENVAGSDGPEAGEHISAPAKRPPVQPPVAACEANPDLIKTFWPHLPLLRKYLRRRVPAADLDDVLQDVFLNIIRRADAAAIAHPKCYLFQAAQAALIDRHRRQTTRRLDCHCQLEEPHHPVDDMSPLRILLAKDEIRAVEDTLNQLPERTQEILVAIRVEGSSLKSLASRYNISTSAIEKHVTKAAKALSVARRSDLVAANRNGTAPQKLLSHSI